jgi:DNA polymerase elongation subunit (family B)
MNVLIVDIETIAPDWNDLPGISRAALSYAIERQNLPAPEAELKQKATREQLSLSPFTGQIAALSVRDTIRAETAVYVVADEGVVVPETNTVLHTRFRTEAELLAEFWQGAKDYQIFVTFNGRAFTVPFLLFRSVANRVRPTIDIAPQRYVMRQQVPYHVDLMDEFSLHGNLPRRPSLALLCGAFGLVNPSVLGGEEVAEAYKEQQFGRIIEKVAGDVETIHALYELWLQHLAPTSFLNAAELS